MSDFLQAVGMLNQSIMQKKALDRADTREAREIEGQKKVAAQLRTTAEGQTGFGEMTAVGIESGVLPAEAALRREQPDPFLLFAELQKASLTNPQLRGLAVESLDLFKRMKSLEYAFKKQDPDYQLRAASLALRQRESIKKDKEDKFKSDWKLSNVEGPRKVDVFQRLKATLGDDESWLYLTPKDFYESGFFSAEDLKEAGLSPNDSSRKFRFPNDKNLFAAITEIGKVGWTTGYFDSELDFEPIAPRADNPAGATSFAQAVQKIVEKKVLNNFVAEEVNSQFPFIQAPVNAEHLAGIENAYLRDIFSQVPSYFDSDSETFETMKGLRVFEGFKAYTPSQPGFFLSE
jgi:hypothetical protein